MSVLCYHSVDPHWEEPISVRPQHFAVQCRWLQRKRVVVPALAYAEASSSGRLRRGAVALTFDDGFADFHRHAAPLLEPRHLPATMFLVAETLQGDGGGATWLRPQPATPPATLTADQVLELQDRGVEFGSHSWAHRDLRELSEEECVRDLRDSRELLSDLLGRDVPLLAYPYGYHAAHVRRAAGRAGHRYAFTLPEGHEPQGDHAVPRVGVYRDNSVTTLRVKATSWYLSARMNPRRRSDRVPDE